MQFAVWWNKNGQQCYDLMHSKPREAFNLVWQAAQPKWEPITEAPMDGTQILATDGVEIAVCHFDSGSVAPWVIEEFLSAVVYMRPTHFMPLPEPPKEVKP